MAGVPQRNASDLLDSYAWNYQVRGSLVQGKVLLKVTSIYIWTWAETLNRNECMTYSQSTVLSWTPVSIYPYCASFLKKELPIRSIYQCCIKKLFILSWTLTVLITWAFLQPIKVLNFLETQMLSLETQMLSLETQMLSLKTHMLSLETQMLSLETQML
mgnify:CR=1 FL=1